MPGSLFAAAVNWADVVAMTAGVIADASSPQNLISE
jgi:hypothetical protein